MLEAHAVEDGLLAGAMDDDKISKWRQRGIIGDDFRPISASRKDSRITRLEKGKPGIYVANTILNVGVDFRYLAAVCRADGGASPTNDIQIPGRASRVNDRGKKYGHLHDYNDKFDKRTARRTGGRVASYREAEWEIEMSEAAKRASATKGWWENGG